MLNHLRHFPVALLISFVFMFSLSSCGGGGGDSSSGDISVSVLSSQTTSGTLLYGAFPGFGLWKHDGTSWSQLTPDLPEAIAAVGSILYGDFGALGLWKYNGTSWSLLTPDNPENIVASETALYGDFGALGLWKYNGTSWSLLTPDNPQTIAVSGSTLYGGFGSLGLWKYNGTSWSKLTSDNPQNIAASGSILYGDFGTLGLWKYNGTSWSLLTPDNPENIAASETALYGDFGTLGLWTYNGTNWSQLTPDNPENIAACGSTLCGDFGTLGVWKYDGTNWSQLTPDNPSIITCSAIEAPTVTTVSGPPSAIGLLANQVITWQSNEAGSYIVELGGSGTPGTGTMLSSGTVSPFTPVNQTVFGKQLSYTSLTPLWIYVTDAEGHTGSASVNLSLKSRVTINAGGELGQITILPNSLKAYVARRDANVVSVIDLNPVSPKYNTVLTSITVGNTPTGIAATPDSSRVYVTNQGQTTLDMDSISVILTATDTVTKTIDIGTNSAPHGIAVTPDGKRAYFTSFDGCLYVLDTDPTSLTYHQIISPLPRTGLLWGYIAITPDSSKALVNWVGSGHAVDIWDVNSSSPTYNTILSTPVPVVSGVSGYAAVTSDSKFGYATDIQNNLCRIDLQTYAIVATGPFSPGWSFALTPDNSTLLMCSGGHDYIRVVNASDMTISDVPMGVSLGAWGGVAIVPDGSRAYVNQNSNAIFMVPLN